MRSLFSVLPARRAHCSPGSRATQGGFTLVELAVVLAVIGLIIGAVAIGKDVQRNAEYTKIKKSSLTSGSRRTTSTTSAPAWWWAIARRRPASW